VLLGETGTSTARAEKVLIRSCVCVSGSSLSKDQGVIKKMKIDDSDDNSGRKRKQKAI
jgi:hypothetical protein